MGGKYRIRTKVLEASRRRLSGFGGCLEGVEGLVGFDMDPTALEGFTWFTHSWALGFDGEAQCLTSRVRFPGSKAYVCNLGADAQDAQTPNPRPEQGNRTNPVPHLPPSLGAYLPWIISFSRQAHGPRARKAPSLGGPGFRKLGPKGLD